LSGISVSSLTLNNTAITGGAVYTRNVKSVIVLRSTFTGITSKGNGGALSIGFTSTFAVNTSTFTTCTSQNANGGAIACLPGGGSALVLFYGVNFTGNSAPNGKGNDFCDISTNLGSSSAYAASSFSSLLSTSAAPRFYHLSADLSFDCLFNGSCQLSNVFLDSVVGSDFFICGEISLPCFSLDTGMAAALFPATFYLNSGDYGIASNYKITDLGVKITGQTAGDGGNVILGNTLTYPLLLLLNSDSSYLIYAYYSTFNASYLVFTYNSSASSSHKIIYGLLLFNNYYLFIFFFYFLFYFYFFFYFVCILKLVILELYLITAFLQLLPQQV
jgi:hypothetical protein